MELARIRISDVRAWPVEVRDIPQGIIGGTVHFEYADPVWDSLTKIVVFRGFVTRDVVDPGDEVPIPVECVPRAGISLYVGVYGTDADGRIAIPTLWADLGRVRAAADPSGDPAADPMLPIWAQLQAQIEQLKQQGVTDEQIAQALSDYLTANPIQTGATPEQAEQIRENTEAIEQLQQIIDNPGGNVDLTGYATESWVKEGYQPKGNYLTEVPEGYAKTTDIPTKPEDIGAQPAGSYLTEVPSGYATEEFVKNKVAEAELGGKDVDLSGYAKKSEIPTKPEDIGAQPAGNYLTEIPSGYATENWVAEGYQPKGSYLTEVPEGYAKTTDIPTKPGDIGAQPAGNYLTEIPSGYATESWVQEGYQPKGNYLTEVPEGYAKTTDIPTKPGDIGAQPAGNYLTAVPSGYATEEYVRNRIAEAELGGEEVDLSGYAQKSEIPTKVSQLQNDSGYLTKHQDISGKLDASALPTAINTALAQAKESGEFDGKTPARGTDYWTASDIAEIKSYVDDAILGGVW